MQIIPAILAQTKEEFVGKVTEIFSDVDMVQIDVMDGKFVSNSTWGTPDEILELHLPVLFEVHLMVENPEDVVGDWVRVGAHRVIFHIEATKNPGLVIEKVRGLGREIGIAVNPETPIAALSEWLNLIDYCLVMGVTPGASGQKFQPKALQKIMELKKIRPGLKVGVDGGVDFDTAREIAAAGADALNAASAIFDYPEPVEAIEILQKI